MRARAQQRTERFLNARTRTMGIDKNFLDQQVEEKRLAKLAEKQADLDQAAYDQSILRVLESNEANSRAAKMEEMRRLRDDLQEHASLPKNSCDKIGTPIDPETCGIGAAQYFAGEDKGMQERRRLQQAQMRQWTRQQIAEKQARTVEEKEESMRFHQYLTAVDNMRAQIEASESNRAKQERLNVRQLNEARAAEQAAFKKAQAELNEAMNQMEFETVKSDPFLNEETDITKSSVASYRVRPDHFKGFNKDQVMYIYKKNEDLVSDHKAAKAQEAADAQAWADHSAMVVKMMEQAEQEQKAQRDYINQLEAKDLMEQRRELAEKKKFSRDDKFGAISNGFFDGFGTSCR